MKSIFTLSLDCEGLWGMADHLSSPELGLIRQEALKEAYQFLNDCLQEFNIRATAAFVSSFAAGSERLMAHERIFDELLRINPNWFGGVVSALKSGRFSGWDGQWCFDLMRLGGHEMAWHGTTHQALTETVSKEAFDLEMTLTEALHLELNHKPTSIVFPRNQVGQLGALAQWGFNVYRDQLRIQGPLGRVSDKLAEFSPIGPSPDPMPSSCGPWTVIAPGRFLHWPYGHRALVPMQITVHRWSAMLNRAANQGGVVHMWFHPHNLLTAPAMRGTLRSILAQVSRHMNDGRLHNLTMAELAGMKEG